MRSLANVPGFLALIALIVAGCVLWNDAAAASGIRALTPIEMREVARGAAPDCDAAGLAFWACSDPHNHCANQAPNCQYDLCTGCDSLSQSETICNTWDRPLIYICVSFNVFNGCGVQMVAPICVAASPNCVCFDPNTDDRFPCDRKVDDLGSHNCNEIGS